MIRRLMILCGAVSVLASCGSTPRPEPEIRTVTVNVPVPVSCVPASANIEPDFKVTKAGVLAAPSPEERYRLAAAGFLEREAWVAEAIAVLRGCRD